MSHTVKLDNVKIIQPSYVSGLMDVSQDDTEKIMSVIFSMMLYMNPGDKMESSFASLEKLDQDLMHIDCHVNKNNLVDFLEKRNIIKIPV